jgi:hypothetical protein
MNATARNNAIIEAVLSEATAAEVDPQAPKQPVKKRTRGPNKPKPTLGVNPKDAVGNKKVSITKFPATAVFHGARAMMNGAAKYGPYNWRDNNVIAGIYVDAAIRHIYAWFEGEEVAKDSGVHHLGHALATIAVLIDAQEGGNLKDDRPGRGSGVAVLERLNEGIKRG